MERICSLCGEKFEATKNQKVCSKKHIRPCAVCKQPFVYYNPQLGTKETCSPMCASVSRRRKFEAKYGVKNFMDIPEIKKRAAENRKGIKPKKKLVPGAPNLPEVAKPKKRRGRKPKGTHKTFAKPQPLSLPALISKDVPNSLFNAMMDSLGIEYVNDYPVGEYVYSAYLPTEKTVLSISPTANNNVFVQNSGSYNLFRAQNAVNHGLRCIHIFDWDDPQKLVASLQPKKSIYARDCKIEFISMPEFQMFIQLYGLYDVLPCISYIPLGLYYQNQLVQVIAFRRPKYTRNYDYEMSHLCTDFEYRVVGGASKLFSKFIKTYKPKSIITSCDLSKFNGNVYSILGMECDHTVPASRWWSKGIDRLGDGPIKFNTARVGFGEVDPALSKAQNMVNLGWLPIYDCGKNIYTWSRFKPKKPESL